MKIYLGNMKSLWMKNLQDILNWLDLAKKMNLKYGYVLFGVILGKSYLPKDLVTSWCNKLKKGCDQKCVNTRVWIIYDGGTLLKLLFKWEHYLSL
jgi:hypothetical protein